MHCNANVLQFCSVTVYQYFSAFSSVFLSNRRIDFFVVCIAMQMFPNSVQSESILILGKFSPAAEKGGRREKDDDDDSSDNDDDGDGSYDIYIL